MPKSFSRIHALHPHWDGDMLLEDEGDLVVHSLIGTAGTYRKDGERLNVDWGDPYGKETFFLVAGSYLHERILAEKLPDVRKLDAVNIHGTSVDISKIAARVPKSGLDVLLRLGTSDPDVFWQVFILNDYASKDFPVRAYTIVDLGANIGLSTAFFALRYPDARISAYEPDASNFEMLQRNIEPFGSRISATNGAAWSETGSVSLISHDASGGALGAWGLQVSSAGDVQVPSYRLEKIFDQAEFDHVDLLKIDIEGAELELFTANPSQWLERVGFICVETHDRFRDGTEAAVRYALKESFEELPASGENLLFRRT